MRVFPLFFLMGLAFADDWKIVNVERTIDISSQIVKVSSQLTLSNTGSAEANSVEVLVPTEEIGRLAHISAQEGSSKGKLKISKQSGEKKGFKSYKIELLNRVAKGGEVKLKVEQRFTELLSPLPEKITQKENQFVVYNGNAYYAAAYPVAQEKTTVKIGNGKTLSATQVAPTNQENERVIYGPYKDQPAFNKKPIKIHYENNSPFVVATVVERTIEVSHWGNIAVEEHIELVHKGAELKGPFSRLDHQMDRRGRRQPALLHFTTVLPASAKDIYYRDEIGNISTSQVRLRADSVEVEIKPRYPLYGGWRTSYVIGYNVPSFEYLYNKGNDYALKMRVLDHIFDNIVVEKLTTKVVLPELVKRIKLTTPYTMDRRPDEVRPTYLDTTGRTVVVLQKENLVPEHIQSFTIFYEFDYAYMIREPLLASAFFLALFTAMIIYMRFDFTIVADPVREARERIQGKVTSLSQLVDKKNRVFSQFLTAVSQYKTSRDVSALQDGKKRLETDRAEINAKLTNAVTTFKEEGQEVYDKAQELLRYEKAIMDALDGYITSVQKSQQKSASPEDTQFTQKVNDARSRSEALLASL
ncbi:Dolichyl-diphosphooligosaccharide--protein glycosyltransferase subunit 1 [Trichostrongylus colubriformis]|uniref:Dolichyl-diphosphooligosaccharide--protein glycosyltransferase subunit 1 n=1 Tax=Trichostrongylus colubriformis TaxID=6319 RepID=A0AAN8F1I2_TRICO